MYLFGFPFGADEIVVETGKSTEFGPLMIAHQLAKEARFLQFSLPSLRLFLEHSISHQNAQLLSSSEC